MTTNEAPATISQITTGFAYTDGRDTFTVVELPTKTRKSFRVTSSYYTDDRTLLVTPRQMARDTGLAL